MTDKAREALDRMVEAAGLLGGTQTKKLYGDYTEQDYVFERAMHAIIARHRAALLEALHPDQGEDAALLDGETALAVLGCAIDKAGVRGWDSANIIGHFCNEWNDAICAARKEQQR
jgi:hypothetical protein